MFLLSFCSLKHKQHEKMLCDFLGNGNTGSPIPIVDLDKDCNGNICLVSKIETPKVIDEKTKVCAIQWEESILSRLDNNDVSTENITELLSFRKVEDEFILTVLHITQMHL